jgi:glycine/D-amino acid oxidase-like deaminating enzyme
LAEAAREYGAKIYENCDVKKVMIGEGKKVYAVETDEGVIDTNVFVNAAGSVCHIYKIFLYVFFSCQI